MTEYHVTTFGTSGSYPDGTTAYMEIGNGVFARTTTEVQSALQKYNLEPLLSMQVDLH